MSIQSGQAKLNKAMKNLTVHWQRTREAWRDPVAIRFEEQFIAPMDQKVRQASTAMFSLGDTLQHIRRECS